MSKKYDFVDEPLFFYESLFFCIYLREIFFNESARIRQNADFLNFAKVIEAIFFLNCDTARYLLVVNEDITRTRNRWIRIGCRCAKARLYKNVKSAKKWRNLEIICTRHYLMIFILFRPVRPRQRSRYILRIMIVSGLDEPCHSTWDIR